MAVFATFSGTEKIETLEPLTRENGAWVYSLVLLFYTKTAVLLTCDLLQWGKQKLATISALCPR